MNRNPISQFVKEVSTIEPASAPMPSAQVLPMEPTQTRRLTPRDINAHLALALENYDALTAQFAQNKLAIDNELAALKHAGSDTSSEIVRLHATLSQQNTLLESQSARSHRAMEELKAGFQSELVHAQELGRAQLQTLGRRLDADVQRLHQGVCAVDDMLATQTGIVREQTERLNQFDVAYELLDTATRGNRSRIEAVREEAQRQHTVALAQLAGLDALQREQSTELNGLRQTVSLLETEAQLLNGAIHVVDQDLVDHVADTRHTFKRTHIALATVLLLVVTGFAMVKWVPAFGPTSLDAALARVQQHLQVVDVQVAAIPVAQTAVAAAQDGKISALADTLKALERRVVGVQSSVRDLRAMMPVVPLGAVALPPLADDQWLQQQDATSLTVQLAGFSSEPALQAYLARHASALAGKSLALTVTQPQGQGARYNLFYGVFDSLQQAREALAALPAKMRSNQPWVRTIAAVQATLK